MDINASRQIGEQTEVHQNTAKELTEKAIQYRQFEQFSYLCLKIAALRFCDR